MLHFEGTAIPTSWLNLPNEMVDFIIQKMKNPRDQLNLRKISKTFKRIVDDILQKSVPANWCPYLSMDLQLFLDQSTGTAFNYLEQIDEFMQIMGGYRENPFPTRCIKLSFPTPDVPALPRNLENFCVVHGMHIRSCTYYGESSNYNFINQVIRIFRLLQNLTNVSLINIPEFEETDGSNFIAVFPFHAHIQSISISGCCDPTLLDAILSAYGNQIVSLDCCGAALEGSQFFQNLSVSLEHRPLPKLEDLRVESITSISFQKLITCSILNLRRLAIITSDEVLSVSRAFRLLNKFRATLSELYFDVEVKNFFNPNSTEVFQEGTVQLEEFPNLVKLSIPFSWTNGPLFLLLIGKFKVLKKLELLNYGNVYPSYSGVLTHEQDREISLIRACAASLKNVSVYIGHIPERDELVSRLP